MDIPITHKRMYRMKFISKVVLVFILGAIVGCGSHIACCDAEALSGRATWLGNLSWRPCLNKSDWQYFNLVANSRGDNLYSRADDIATREVQPSPGDYWCNGSYVDTAWAKRKAALLHARCKLTYSWGTWLELDGISSIIYNVTYIFSAPCKILKTLRCSDGILGWLKDVVSIFICVVLAFMGLFVETVLGIVVHPIETLANICGIMNFGEGWFNYFIHTNIITSLWDLFWGGVIYPLWQALVFWL